MAQEKTVHQLNTADGKASSQAVAAPDWFALDSTEPAAGQGMQWGPVYSQPRSGNKVEFLTTGADYFHRVQGEIEKAKSSVFIAGWQVNFDVELTPGKTLLSSLVVALRNGAQVYVMPWQNPGTPDTGALFTALAVALLNGVPGIKGRAHCLGAPVQSDQGMGNIMFSHHQKQVVIDNKVAFMGGIDLAYGRRDDATFSLKANGRHFNELYNSCVPPIEKFSRVDVKHCVTQLELLAAIGTKGFAQWVLTFATSPSDRFAWSLDHLDSAKEKIDEGTDWVKDAWNNVNLMRDFMNAVHDRALDAAQDVYQSQVSPLKQKLEALAATGAANAANAASAVLALLNGQSIQALPLAAQAELGNIITSLGWLIAMVTNNTAWEPPEYYERLFTKGRALPAKAVDPNVQPRMPWQDVQCRIEGPSVFDLSRNFVERWNSAAYVYERGSARYRHAVATSLAEAFGIQLPAARQLPRITGALRLKAPAAPVGGCTLQVMRSAPRTLQRDERAANGDSSAPTLAQNNCLKALLKAISSARHFIYIEGQFFQTAHGAYGPTQASLSGPMSSLLEFKNNAHVQRFKEMLGIVGAKPSEIPGRIRWSKVDDVLREAHGPEFMLDLKTVLETIAMREVLTQPTSPQSHLLNPVGRALIERITRVGIQDGRPFHVYLVLPVHPEGTLNTLNIMSQVHLTMHSLVFGEHSLVNGVRRAILTDRIRRQKKVSWAVAKAQVNSMALADIVDQARHDWKRFVTLLNLRNWDQIGGQPVTEQIYIHSKLLIADDQVAVLGSANINDRSLMGDRDSELATIITSSNKVHAPIAGPMQSVAREVHELRVALWKKHFGAATPGRAATALLTDAVLKRPGVPATWEAIQKRAEDNADRYERAFAFIPRSKAQPQVQTKEAADRTPDGPPASVWPTWHYQTYLDHAKGGQLRFRMPFDPLFWREPERKEVANSWTPAPGAPNAKAASSSPIGVQSFIVALPTEWARGENNMFSASHIRTIATTESPPSNTSLAQANGATQQSEVAV